MAPPVQLGSYVSVMEWREQSAVGCDEAYLEAQRWIEVSYIKLINYLRSLKCHLLVITIYKWWVLFLCCCCVDSIQRLWSVYLAHREFS